MQTEFTALQQTALSPVCHLPADPADPKSRAHKKATSTGGFLF